MPCKLVAFGWKVSQWFKINQNIQILLDLKGFMELLPLINSPNLKQNTCIRQQQIIFYEFIWNTNNWRKLGSSFTSIVCKVFPWFLFSYKNNYTDFMVLKKPLQVGKHLELFFFVREKWLNLKVITFLILLLCLTLTQSNFCDSSTFYDYSWFPA